MLAEQQAPLPAQEVAEGIYCIDVDYIRPQLACCYLIVDGDHAAFIDCGTTHSTDRLFDALCQLGLGKENVRYVIPTHVHLDHAGGAGALMQACPDATLLVHPKGAQHLVEPSRLISSVKSVYGEDQFHKLYGTVAPVSKERVYSPTDNEILKLGSRALTFIDTPGHARHHFCIYDERSRAWFTGDTFGISYPRIQTQDGPYLLPTTTPVQFEPDAWERSIDRLLEKQPEKMLLTHFGRIDEVKRLASQLRTGLDRYVAIAEQYRNAPNRVLALEHAITDYTLEDLRSRGCKLSEEEIRLYLEMDLRLNAQGVDIWLSRSD